MVRCRGLGHHPGVLLYPTMGAAARGIPVERRWAHVEELARRGMGMTLVDPGSGLPWSVAVLGGDVVECGLAELAVRRGGHVRVGLEDHAGPGEPSNAELLRGLLDLLRDMGREPASIAEARTILGVPPRPAGLWGRTFAGDAPQGLGEGTPVRMTFTAPDGIAVHAGGNRLGFRATASAGRLTVDDRVRSTRLACPPDVQALDDWLVALLTGDPAYALDGQSLTLATGTTRIDLVESPEQH
ncbi:MAG: 3-keto-5-aminohexanoate cleavage protein [Pseudonocardia sp.]|nr:3-keto-5-aminohexanoate cleavage protein [Pseudonocardia sp.]